MEVTIKFIPSEELTSKDYDEIIEFISQYGNEVKVSENKD